MTGDKVRQVCEAILPQEEIDGLCRGFGVVERQRKLKLGMFVRAMVISAGTPGGAYQADVLRSYLEFEVPPVARSAFYRWFDEPLERFMAALADRALAYARAQQGDLAGPLCGVTDWSIVDAPTITVRDALRAEFPASTIAALLARTHNVQTRPQQAGTPRTEAPLHARRLALQLAVSCQSIAQAFELTGAQAIRRWDKIAELLTHPGKIPIGANGPPSSINYAPGNANPRPASRPTAGMLLLVISRQPLKWTHMRDRHMEV